MPLSIPGFGSTFLIPGVYADDRFAQGLANGSGVRDILLLGNKLSSGDATVDSSIYGPLSDLPLNSEADAIARFGQGSELHRDIRRILRVNKNVNINAVAVTESVGAKATGAFTLSGTATSAATLTVYMGDDSVDVSIASGDGYASVAANVQTRVNSKLDWAATCVSDIHGLCTLTAKQKGLRGNELRFSVKILPACGVVSTVNASTAFSGGTTADDNTAALATILPFHFYRIVSAASDATQVGALVSQVGTQALATNGNRQRVFSASVDTLANATTFAVALNDPLTDVQWLYQSDLTCGELAANLAAVVSLEEDQAVPVINFDNYGKSARTAANWKVPAPRSGAAPSEGQIGSALLNGLSPIRVLSNRSTHLVKLITSRSLNGATSDLRITDHGKVTITQFFTEDLVLKLADIIDGKNIGSDPKGNQSPPANVVTPRILRAASDKLVREYGEAGLVQDVQGIIAGTIVERSSNPTSRFMIMVPLEPSDPAHQVGIIINQVA